MWQIPSAQTGEAVKVLKRFIPMMKSGSHVLYFKDSEMSSSKLLALKHLGKYESVKDVAGRVASMH